MAEFDVLDERLLDWLGGALPGRRVERTVPLAGGFSNDNVMVVTTGGETYVLRRYLRHNSCAVEAALAERLAGVVPVADVVASDPSGAEAGRPVLLSRCVPGALVSELLPDLGGPDSAELGRAVGRVLARIGTVTFARPGFFDGADLVPGPSGTEPASGLGAFVERILRTGNAGQAMTPAEQDGLRRLAAAREPLLAAVHGSRRLVHSDFNPKNLLAERRGDGWTVTAVLDWEFAFSGSPLVDVGNMLRFPDDVGPAFAEGFVAAFGAECELPANWRELSLGLDLYALADFLTRPPEHPFFGRAVALLRRQLVNCD